MTLRSYRALSSPRDWLRESKYAAQGMRTRINACSSEHTRISRCRFYPKALLALALVTFVLIFARGMILPFLVMYFAEVLGLGEALVGAGIALSSAVGVGATLALTSTIDRYGARRVLLYPCSPSLESTRRSGSGENRLSFWYA
ncbi:MAG: hypothetical protein ACK42I_00590 [Thermomicrobium sp.]